MARRGEAGPQSLPAWAVRRRASGDGTAPWPGEPRSFGRVPARACRLPRRRLAVASRRGQRPSGGCLARAETGQRDCNPMWPGLRQPLCKVPIHQYSNHTVMVVSGGPTGGSPTEGSGLSRGGNTVGGTRSSEEVRRPREAVGRGFLRGTDDPGRRTFRSLEWHPPSAVAVSGRFGRFGSSRRGLLSSGASRTALALKPCSDAAFWVSSARLHDATRTSFVDLRPDSRLEQVVSNRPQVSLIPQIVHLPSTVAP